MPYNYRWARGEAKAIELATKVSHGGQWSQCETIARCGNVTCQLYEFKLDGDEYYKDYWLCYQHTSIYPDDPAKWNTTIGFSTDMDFPQLPIKRLKDGLEKIYK